MATLEQIQARVMKLQAQAEAIVAKSAQAAVDQIRELMLKHGLTTADIEAKAKAKRDAKAGGRTAASKGAKAPLATKGKLPAKYLNPKTGETWSGHARPPAWIKDVKDRTKFLINGAGPASPTKTVGTTTAKTSVRKVQSKGALSAKYRDPKSGATWSGRGPAPKWLAAAKDRTKFLIEHVSDAKSDSSAIGLTTESKAARKLGAVSKKIGAKKTGTSMKKAAMKKAARKASAKTSAKTTVTAKKASARNTAARKVSPPTAASTPTHEVVSTPAM
ncbi:histone family protein nucleoid-structuring protein H-NS [Caballeronia glebae]|uniref:Histone family protein nucleoid-structuring protein H-NS n=1 Tax=Caballeronia glebae TaxID=1777143 RepID=A0A158D8J7_9BURK|nr:H-NS family nucleoid-associated regulatory protein [Caballeronia glebae]SAK90690.1 histone family protein nucleoid-structuring protein H-NS [Caballeronia glebae]